MPLVKKIPVVFISSTVEDLKLYRSHARDAAIRAGFYPLMQEYFVARDNPPLKECLERVEHADVVVVIVAHRYGWVPQDQPGAETKSITWLECEKAAQDGKDVLAFVVDEKCEWPHKLKESYRTMAAVEQGKAAPELLAEVQRNVARLRDFKQWLGTRTRRSFITTDGLGAEIEASLCDWLKRHIEFAEPAQPHAADDPRRYLQTLREQVAWIDVRGFQVDTHRKFLQRFPIEELYIPLTISGNAGERDGLCIRRIQEPGTSKLQLMALEEALAHRKLVIVGDPGAGKTTLLKHIAFTLADAALKHEADSGLRPATRSQALHDDEKETSSLAERLAAAFMRANKVTTQGDKHVPEKHSDEASKQYLAVLIRLAELADHIHKCLDRPEYTGPTLPHSPSWILDFLHCRNHELNWGLSEGFFRQRIEAGSVVLLFDGLDEVAGGNERHSMARLLEQAAQAYKNCRFIVTTRPLAYTGESTLADFELAQIEPWGQESARMFLEHWCQHVYRDNPLQAEAHLTILLGTLNNQIEVRRMATNPVMLTALATIHWNEQHLPEGRAELYHSVLRWLMQTREQRKDREPPNRCLVLLQRLALAMQDSDLSSMCERSIQISRRRAAEILEMHFPGTSEQRLENACAFLEQEEMDSGIIVSRGNEVRFWHLTFQEYLTARAIAGLPDADQYKFLLEANKLFQPEWREVVLFLAGILLEQGKAKVDSLVSTILNRLDQQPTLTELAQCVGLVGAIVRELHSFKYEPTDSRYQVALEKVLGIFQAEKAKQIDLKVRLAAAEALGHAGDPRIAPGENKWVAVTAGSFIMGAQKQDLTKPNYDSEAHFHEFPAHEVRLAAYKIGIYPVTVEEYRRFMEEGGYHNEVWWKFGGFSERSQPEQWEDQLLHPNRPVIHVTWYEAAAWCAWAGGRLPTEAEWERAARGSQSRKYPWGEEEPEPDRADYSKTNLGHVTPVGLFPLGMTPDGIHDLSGNVWEWIGDLYDDSYYAKSPSVNPTGPTSGQYRVVRGGSFVDGAGFLRASFRGRCDPGNGDYRVGFRCAW